MTTNALHGMSARGRAVNGYAKARKQEILTPDDILDAARKALGGEIRIDPCAASNPKDWFATRINKTLPPEAQVLVRKLENAYSKERQAELERALKPYYLAVPSFIGDGSFVNQPFNFLERWMRLCARSARDARRPRIVQLLPVRPRRRWWPKYAAGANGVFLADFPFKGEDNNYPESCALLAFNCEIPPLGELETGRFRLEYP